MDSSRLDGLGRLSLLFVAVGIVVVYVASVVYAPPHVRVADVDGSYVGKTIRVDGNITRHQETDAATFMTIQDGSSRITGVAFQDVRRPERYQEYVIEGEVGLYRGELELIVSALEPAPPD